jgi:hypothetical protein
MKETKSLYNPNAIKEIAEERQRWQESSGITEASASDDQEYQTMSGLNLKAIYTPEDIAEIVSTKTTDTLITLNVTTEQTEFRTPIHYHSTYASHKTIPINWRVASI